VPNVTASRGPEFEQGPFAEVPSWVGVSRGPFPHTEMLKQDLKTYHDRFLLNPSHFVIRNHITIQRHITHALDKASLNKIEMKPVIRIWYDMIVLCKLTTLFSDQQSLTFHFFIRRPAIWTKGLRGIPQTLRTNARIIRTTPSLPHPYHSHSHPRLYDFFSLESVVK